MDHDEAVKQMAVEKYLLNELPSELRDAFEDHFFDCQECAFDLRAGSAFVDEAKLQLPQLATAEPSLQPAGSRAAEAERQWAARKTAVPWWRRLITTPAFVGPVFAALLVVVGYQNLVTMPTLRSTSEDPRLVPMISLNSGTRGGPATIVNADRKQGVILQVDLPDQGGFSAYAVDLYDPAGKLAWTQKTSPISSSGDSTPDTGTVSLMIPGAGLQQGLYALAISGVDASGRRTEFQRSTFEIHLKN
jgi:hypothetical protein